jgi:chromosome segregation ATPase
VERVTDEAGTDADVAKPVTEEAEQNTTELTPASTQLHTCNERVESAQVTEARQIVERLREATGETRLSIRRLIKKRGETDAEIGAAQARLAALEAAVRTYAAILIDHYTTEPVSRG